MDCACSIDSGDYDGDPSDFDIDLRPKARIQHKCHECGRIIEPGEVYSLEKGKYDGRFYAYKICLDCISLRKTFFCSFTYGEIWSDMREHISESKGEILDSRILQLTPRAREMVFERIEEYWDEMDEEAAA